MDLVGVQGAALASLTLRPPIQHSAPVAFHASRNDRQRSDEFLYDFLNAIAWSTQVSVSGRRGPDHARRLGVIHERRTSCTHILIC
jgi:hypothetical protein